MGSGLQTRRGVGRIHLTPVTDEVQRITDDGAGQ